MRVHVLYSMKLEMVELAVQRAPRMHILLWFFFGLLRALCVYSPPWVASGKA